MLFLLVCTRASLRERFLAITNDLRKVRLGLRLDTGAVIAYFGGALRCGRDFENPTFLTLVAGWRLWMTGDATARSWSDTQRDTLTHTRLSQLGCQKERNKRHKERKKERRQTNPNVGNEGWGRRTGVHRPHLHEQDKETINK